MYLRVRLLLPDRHGGHELRQPLFILTYYDLHRSKVFQTFSEEVYVTRIVQGD
jgi:hypothetical protein